MTRGEWQTRRDLVVFGLAYAALVGPLLRVERRMRRTGGPGIIGFELARTTERADEIIEQWGPSGQAAARTSLVLDYPYLVAYSGLQRACCELAGGALREAGSMRLAGAGSVIGLAQWGAGALDAIENAALLGVLSGRRGRLPAIAFRSACAKFAVLTIGWMYMAAGVAAHRRSRGAGDEPAAA